MESEKLPVKLIATLPATRHYRSLQSSREGRYVFEDIATPALRIQSPTPSPWGHEWKMALMRQKQKSDRSEYPYRLVVKLFPLDGEGIPAKLEREEVKGVFAWADYQPLAFFAFPTGRNLWLFYSFYKK